jgi:hypothetical protein
VTDQRPGPGILKVFWPAFLGWGCFTGSAVSYWHFRTGDGCHVLTFVGNVCEGGLLVATISAAFVTVLVAEARRPVPIVLNSSVLIATVWVVFFMPRYIA